MKPKEKAIEYLRTIDNDTPPFAKLDFENNIFSSKEIINAIDIALKEQAKQIGHSI